MKQITVDLSGTDLVRIMEMREQLEARGKCEHGVSPKVWHGEVFLNRDSDRPKCIEGEPIVDYSLTDCEACMPQTLRSIGL